MSILFLLIFLETKQYLHNKREQASAQAEKKRLYPRRRSSAINML